jgi:hypothetical protein
VRAGVPPEACYPATNGIKNTTLGLVDLITFCIAEDKPVLIISRAIPGENFA